MSTATWFDTPENVATYAALCEGYDALATLRVVREHIPLSARVLELGMGPGTDLDALADAGYDVVGSDRSEAFLRAYAERGGGAKTLLLDAITLDTEQRFDALFTNKVLQHLTREQAAASLARQAEILEPGALMLHSLGVGEGADEHHGMLFTRYTKASFEAVLPASATLEVWRGYTEMEADDSAWALVRMKAV